MNNTATPVQQAGSQQAITARVENVTLSAVTTEGLRLSVAFSAVSSRDVTADRLSFEDVRLNGVPVYVAPLSTELRLAKGKAVQLAALDLSIYYRDLDSLDPVVALLERGELDIRTTLVADVELSQVARLALWMRRGVVVTRLSSRVPVDIPGGETVRKRSLAAVQAAGKTLEWGQKIAARLPVMQSAARDEVLTAFLPVLLIGRSHFEMKRKGEVRAFDCTSLGFLVDPKRFLSTREMTEAWRYQPEIAGNLQSGGAKLDARAYRLVFAPATTLASADRQQFRMAPAPSPETGAVLHAEGNGSFHKIQLAARQSSSNAVLGEFLEPGGAEIHFDFGEACGEAAGAQAYAFRVRSRAGVPRVERVSLRIHCEAGRILFSPPLDSGSWGSPLVVGRQIVGLIQSETSALPIGEAFRVLSLPLAPNRGGSDKP